MPLPTISTLNGRVARVSLIGFCTTPCSLTLRTSVAAVLPADELELENEPAGRLELELLRAGVELEELAAWLLELDEELDLGALELELEAGRDDELLELATGREEELEDELAGRLELEELDEEFTASPNS